MKQRRRKPLKENDGTPPRTIEEEAGPARSKGVRLLAASAKSARQLTERLERAGYSAEVARRAVESLVALRLIDEEALGHAVVRRVRRSGPASRGFVRAKLIATGLDEELAERVLGEELEGTDDEGEAVALVRFLAAGTRSGSGAGPADRNRILRAVARRGFEAETARRAVRMVLGKGGPGKSGWE